MSTSTRSWRSSGRRLSSSAPASTLCQSSASYSGMIRRACSAASLLGGLAARRRSRSIAARVCVLIGRNPETVPVQWTLLDAEMQRPR